jgi:hypothetical protein
MTFGETRREFSITSRTRIGIWYNPALRSSVTGASAAQAVVVETRSISVVVVIGDVWVDEATNGTKLPRWYCVIRVARLVEAQRSVGGPRRRSSLRRSDTARLLVPGFELAGHSLDLVVKGLVGILFRVVKSQAADREIDEFMIAPRSRPE